MNSLFGAAQALMSAPLQAHTLNRDEPAGALALDGLPLQVIKDGPQRPLLEPGTRTSGGSIPR